MQPRFETLPSRTFVGMRQQMSFVDHRPQDLWRAFIPRIAEVKGRLGQDRFSMAQYGPGFFTAFDPQQPFTKWAAVEVEDGSGAPQDMAAITVHGLYAVFLHKGMASEGPRVFQHIFGTWLPASGYELDQRPHFEVLTPAYRPDDPHAQEELWIPVLERSA